MGKRESILEESGVNALCLFWMGRWVLGAQRVEEEE